jgi:hypothetical protein
MGSFLPIAVRLMQQSRIPLACYRSSLIGLSSAVRGTSSNRA